MVVKKKAPPKKAVAKKKPAPKKVVAKKPVAKKPPVVTTKTGAVTKPKPVVPTEKQWLGLDPDYMAVTGNIQNLKSQFDAEKQLKLGNIENEYNTGFNQASEANKKSVGDIINSYAARGMVRSGLYGREHTEQAGKLATATSALGTARTAGTQELENAQTKFNTEQSSTEAQARARAIARRAQKYGLGI